MEPKTYTMCFVCECYADDCPERLSDQDYEWFTNQYDVTEFAVYHKDCKSKPLGAKRIAGRDIYVVLKGSTEVACECGENCGQVIPIMTYVSARREYPDERRFQIRHPNCQTSIDFTQVVVWNVSYIVYDTQPEPTLDERNRRLLSR